MAIRNTQYPFLEKISFLEKDEHACYFFFKCLTIHYNNIIHELHAQNNDCYNISTEVTTSHKHRYQFINYIFIQKPEYNNIIDEIAKNWSFLNKNADKKLYWLDRNDIENCKVHYDKVLDFLRKTKEINIPENNFINSTEMYLEIFFILNYCLNEELSNILIKELSKAYSQIKFREKMKGKKPLNIHIEEETKKHLDYLVKHYKIKHHSIIEKLINDEYDILSQNGKKK